MTRQRMHLVGVGGSGMSALAVVLAGGGVHVTGSDRDYDRGRGGELFDRLQAAGVELIPQDGSFAAGGRVDAVVVSGAVESRVADVQAARDAAIPVRRRAEVLAELLGRGKYVAVAGTSGKSTVTAMIAWILRETGRASTFLGGAPLVARPDGAPEPGRAPGPGAWIGPGEPIVAEVDESDGTLILYRPDIGIVTNLSEDHRPLAELAEQFTAFAAATKGPLVMQVDPARRAGWSPPEGVDLLTFGLGHDADLAASRVEAGADGVRFEVAGETVGLRVGGRFNVENALAALATARALEVPHEEACAALGTFPGIARRMERVGQASGITVFDDFAHNPDKVACALAALHESGSRLRIVFQLHGFGPARMHRKGLVQAFAEGLRREDRLYLLPIYYAGGTVSRDITAEDYVADLKSAGVDAVGSGAREELPARLSAESASGDIVAIMGARDPQLPLLARQVLAVLLRP